MAARLRLCWNSATLGSGDERDGKEDEGGARNENESVGEGGTMDDALESRLVLSTSGWVGKDGLGGAGPRTMTFSSSAAGDSPALVSGFGDEGVRFWRGDGLAARCLTEEEDRVIESVSSSAFMYVKSSCSCS